MILVNLFTFLVYQPFFNILVFFYWGLNQVTNGQADMGIAVILLTLLIRFLLLPISLMQDRSEEERRDLAVRAKQLESELAAHPMQLRHEMKQLFRSKPQVVAGELLSLGVQVTISLMLWRIFGTGLEGKDLHLLYSFMPAVEFPYNLVFLGRFDLSHTSFFLNFVQSFLIFVLETLSVYTSPYPATRAEVVRLQLVLPVVAFLVFMFLPSGKKLFVITTLLVSIVIKLYKYIRRRFSDYQAKKLAEETQGADQLVVEVK